MRTSTLVKILAVISCGLAAFGCGGGGGKSVQNGQPVLMSSAQGVLPDAGGVLSTANGQIRVTVPDETLTGDTPIAIAEYSGVPLGNDGDSQSVTNTVEVSIDGASVSDDGQISISMASRVAPPAGTEPFLNLKTSDGAIIVLPAQYESATSRVQANIPRKYLVSPPVSRLPGLSVRALVMARIASLVAAPEPRVTLYKFEKIVNFGDPESSIYKDTFTQNWNREVSPDWSSRHIAIVVHGINNDLSNLTELAFYLKNLKRDDGTRLYDDVYGVDTRWTAAINGNGRELAALLQLHGRSTTRIDLFGHSQGGLVCRSALENWLPGSGFGGKVEKLVTLSTPHKGVDPMVVRMLVENRFVERLWPGLADLTSDSGFITNLNAPAARIATDYVTLGGNDFQSYKFKAGPITIPFGEIAHFVTGEVCDGIVPLSSAAALTGTQANTVTFLAAFPLTHSAIRGLIMTAPGAPLNLDRVGSDRLRDYLLSDPGDSGGISISNFLESSLRYIGEAAAHGGELRIVSATPWVSGAAWHFIKQSVTTTFSTEFTFRIDGVGGLGDTPGADGFAFVIQNQGEGAIGANARGLGYEGIANSIAVEFDTYRNAEYGDPNANHMAIQTRGMQFNLPDHSQTLGITSAIPDLKDGNVHLVRITYSGFILKVFLDDMTTPKLSVGIDLAQLLNLPDGTAYVGFTGGTGSSYENESILHWKFTVNP